MIILLALSAILIISLLIFMLRHPNNDVSVISFNSSRQLYFPVSPDLDPPTSLYSIQTLNQILSNPVYTPEEHKIIGLWNFTNADTFMLIEDETDIPNPFIRAAFYAYSKHFPLSISVDDIWLIILQTASLKINNNSEELRHNFVNFSDKMILKVRRDNFILDSLDNDWGGVAEEFVELIGENTIGDFDAISKTTFSTTSDVSRVASAMTIMESVKSFFDYRLYTLCGFPYIILEGNESDWLLLKNTTIKLLAKLGSFGKEWAVSLLPLLDKMMEPFADEIDTQFWNSMVKRGGRLNCVPDHYISGWINILFPFLISTKLAKNTYSVPYQSINDYANPKFSDLISFDDETFEGYYEGADVELFPIGLASVPVEWCYLSALYNLKFNAGFLGVTQSENGLIRPQVGWYVLREISPKTPEYCE
ncbi:hypothetical protein LOD99_13261 [Oopsacas minuta]|uniref:Uncharacterized protein n=1 Tax=Oopsacas minuta TaxID=111878 RepID=A0AAV7JBB6_9METZ|nr:hypothetical protein LOD99_13261 [Oopsacas minuta]